MTRIDDTQLEQAFTTFSNIEPPNGLRTTILEKIGISPATPVMVMPVNTIDTEVPKVVSDTVIVMPTKKSKPAWLSMAVVASLFLVVMVWGFGVNYPPSLQKVSDDEAQLLALNTAPLASDTLAGDLLSDGSANGTTLTDPLVTVVGF